MTYKIVQLVEGDMITTCPTDIIAWANVAGVEVTGENRNKVHRSELQGQPVLKGFAGPMWDGDGVIRYEDWKSCEILSN